MKQVSSWNFQTVNDSGITLVNLPGGSTGNWTWYEVCCALWPNYIDLILIAISRSTITVHCSSSSVLCCCVHNRRTGIVLRHTCISLWVCGSYCLSHKMTLLTWNYNKTVDSPAEVKETQMQKSFLGSKSTTDNWFASRGGYVAVIRSAYFYLSTLTTGGPVLFFGATYFILSVGPSRKTIQLTSNIDQNVPQQFIYDPAACHRLNIHRSSRLKNGRCRSSFLVVIPPHMVWFSSRGDHNVPIVGSGVPAECRFSCLETLFFKPDQFYILFVPLCMLQLQRDHYVFYLVRSVVRHNVCLVTTLAHL